MFLHKANKIEKNYNSSQKETRLMNSVNARLFKFLLLLFCLGEYSNSAEIYNMNPNERREQKGVFGAEIELNFRYLSPFISYIDFDELENRLIHGIDLGPHATDTQTLLSDITKDLPLSMSDFLEVIPNEVKNTLLSGLSDLSNQNLVESRNSNHGIDVPGIMQREGVRPLVTKQNFILPEKPWPLGSQNEVYIGKKDLIISDTTYRTHFWQQVNSRWSQTPAIERLKLVPWNKLPHSSKSKLLVYLYHLLTTKVYGPKTENFTANVLGLKFSDPKVEALFLKYYGARDGSGIVEFHTLVPKVRNIFFDDLKEFLKFIGVEHRVLFPGVTQRNDIGLHIHYSSDKLNLSKIEDLEEFVSNYKRMMIFRALAKGDISVLISPPSEQNRGVRIFDSDISYVPRPSTRDLVAVSYANKTVEMRYFFADVEKEMRELETVSEMNFLEVQTYTYKELGKVANLAIIDFILTHRAEMFFDLLPFEVWSYFDLPYSEHENFLNNVRKNSFDIKKLSSFLIRDLKPRLESRRALTLLQSELAEVFLAKASIHPFLIPEVLTQIFKLKKQGVVFRNELIDFNNDVGSDHPDHAFESRIRHFLLGNLSWYLKNVKSGLTLMRSPTPRDIEDEFHKSFPRNWLALLTVIRMSSEVKAFEKIVLLLLSEPGSRAMLKESFADKAILLSLKDRELRVSESFKTQIEQILRGTMQAKQQYENERHTSRAIICRDLL